MFRCVSSCLEAQFHTTKYCWDTPVKNGYGDCGSGFVNSMEDLPVSLECCSFPAPGWFFLAGLNFKSIFI